MYSYSNCMNPLKFEREFQRDSMGVYIEDYDEVERMVNHFNELWGNFLKINLEEAKKLAIEINTRIDDVLLNLRNFKVDENGQEISLKYFDKINRNIGYIYIIDRNKLTKNSNYIKKQFKKAFYYIDFTESDKLEKMLGDKYYSSEMFTKFIYPYLENSIGKIGPKTTDAELIKLITPTLESIEKLLELENAKGFGLAHRVFHTFYEIEDVRNYIDVYYVVVQKEIFYELLGEKTKKYFLFLREFL